MLHGSFDFNAKADAMGLDSGPNIPPINDLSERARSAKVGIIDNTLTNSYKALGDSASVQDQKSKKVILNSAHAPRTPERFFGASIRSRQ
jgi:hypothetical protein